MSYSHWSNADIYVCLDPEGHFCCIKCPMNSGADFTTQKRSELITHCRAHQKRGHKVPENLFTRLGGELVTLGDAVRLEQQPVAKFHRRKRAV